MSAGLKARIDHLEAQLAEIAGRLKGPPWQKLLFVGNEKESDEEILDKHGVPRWKRGAIGVVRLVTPEELEAEAKALEGAPGDPGYGVF